MDANPYLHFLWMRQVLFDHFGEFTIKDHPEMNREEALNLYMMWALKHRFLHTFGNPEPIAGIILRPVNPGQLDEIKKDWTTTFTLFDVGSRTVWIDFMHAPDNMPFMIDFVKQCGYPIVAYHNARRNGIKIMRVEDLTIPSNTQAQGPVLTPLDLNYR